MQHQIQTCSHVTLDLDLYSHDIRLGPVLMHMTLDLDLYSHDTRLGPVLMHMTLDLYLYIAATCRTSIYGVVGNWWRAFWWREWGCGE